MERAERCRSIPESGLRKYSPPGEVARTASGHARPTKQTTMYIPLVPVIEQMINRHKRTVGLLQSQLTQLRLAPEEVMLVGELIDQTRQTIRELEALKKTVQTYADDNDSERSPD